MIKGLSVDNTRPLPAPTTARKTEKQNDFADQLMGAKSERVEKPDRNERKNSGRDTDREGYRSVDREKDSKASDLRASKARAEKREERSDRKASQDDSSINGGIPASQHIPNSRAPASQEEPPIVIEAPTKSEPQEMKLPDFFSKASLEKARAGAVDGQATVAGTTGEASENAALLASMKQEEVGTREEAMGEFVTRMQDELGIAPEKLLQAFAQLDDKAFMASPEDSMGELLQSLDLPPGKEARATELYQDLLKTTGDSLLNEGLAGLDEKSVNFDVMSQRDASLQKLHSSLENMNTSFFRKAARDPKSAQSAVESMDLALSKMMREPKADGMQAQALAQAELAPADDTVSSTTSDMSAITGLMGANANVLEQMEADADGGSMSNGGEKGLGQTSAVKDTKAALKSAFAQEMSDIAEMDDSDSDSDVVGTETVVAKDGSDASPLAAAIGGPVANAPKSMMTPSQMMMNRQPTAQEEQDNVHDLIKEAQVLVKRGGGEMKMEMKPEGMGSIQLRVNVENGKVNVQMLTESESAKHLLERGLSELKTNLAAHELKVQSLSVDVGNDVKNQMDQQGTQDQARQQARQFASDFMGSFRDERQGFRQGMLDNKGWRSYGRGQERGDVSENGQVKAAAATRDRSDKRLNLVA